MTEYRRPGVYIEERLLTNVQASTASASALFVGAAPNGRSTDPVRIETWGDYVNEFGGISKVADASNVNYKTYLPYAVYSYFQNGGRPAYVQRAVSSTEAGEASGIIVPSNTTVAITNAAWEGNVATITAVGHPFNVGDRVLVEDVEVTAFNSAATSVEDAFIVTAVDGDDFSYALDVDSIGATNEVQTITIDATGGTFTITFDGDTTDALAYNASASVVSSALRGLDSVGTGNVSVSLSGLVYTVTFLNALAGTNVPAMTTNAASLTGGAGTATVATGTPGAAYSAAATGTVIGPDRTNPAFTLASKNVGSWANFSFGTGVYSDKGIAVEITYGEDVQTLPVFNVTVYLDGVIVERFRNIVVGDAQPGLKNIEQAINDLSLGSQIIKVVSFDADLYPIVTDYPTTHPTANPGDPWVPRSYDGAFGRNIIMGELVGTNPDLPSSTDLLAAAQDAVGKIDQPLLVNVPGYINGSGDYVSTLLNSSSFVARTDVFVVNDYAPQRAEGQTSGVYASSIKSDPGGLGSAFNDSFVAPYTPWLVIPDPQVSSGVVTIPPGGAVCGAISRIDTTIGVFRAPAGMVANLSNVIGVDTTYTDSQLAELNSANINVIKPVAGVGIAIMGARTRKQFGVDRYVSGRRTLIFIEESLRRSSAFAIFENNSERLWTQLKLSTENFLRNLWEQGGLRGATADEAFFVVCDATLNTPAVIASGEVRMDIGVALEYPAEFVVLRISQFESGGFRAEFVNNTV